MSVAHDGPELLDVGPAAVNSLGTLHTHSAADVPVIDTVTSCGPRSLLVQQRQPRSHGNTDDDDDTDDASSDADEETVGAGDAKLAVVQPGE